MPFDMTEFEALSETQWNCLHLANVIERGEYKFDMLEWANASCGTAGCIAGTAAAVWWPGWMMPHSGKLDRKLGLPPNHRLFTLCRDGNGKPLALSDIDRHMAVAALRRFALTGEIYFDPADRGVVGAGLAEKVPA